VKAYLINSSADAPEVGLSGGDPITNKVTSEKTIETKGGSIKIGFARYIAELFLTISNNLTSILPSVNLGVLYKSFTLSGRTVYSGRQKSFIGWLKAESIKL